MLNFRSVVAPNNIWNFDELVLPHESKQDPLISFIPRKPHPNGIVAYLAAVQLSWSKLPFLMDILPVTSDSGLSGPHAFQAFLSNVKGKLYP